MTAANTTVLTCDWCGTTFTGKGPAQVVRDYARKRSGWKVGIPASPLERKRKASLRDACITCKHKLPPGRLPL